MKAAIGLSLALALLAAPVLAGDRVQVTIFGGASLLDIGVDNELYPQCFAPPPEPSRPLPILPNGDGGGSFAAPCGPINVRRQLGGSFLHGASVGYRVSRRATLSGAFSTAP